MTESVADALQPVYIEVCRKAAEADIIHKDGTSAQVLSLDKEREEKKGTDAEDSRTGTFTTAIIAKLEEEGIKIGLFFTGRKHAGENLDDLLGKRKKDLCSPIQQCDALSRNVPKNHETQLSNCNAHGRRKFYELVDGWAKAVTKIIGLYGIVFMNEKLAPKDPQERPVWHQQKSKSAMGEIKAYYNGLLEKKEVESNKFFSKNKFDNECAIAKAAQVIHLIGDSYIQEMIAPFSRTVRAILTFICLWRLRIGL